MIQIVNWLLTRRCNLNCDYCAIVRNYEGMPLEYPKMKHYKVNEMSTEVVLNALTAFKKHNPNMFHIFYGGEPVLRKDLPQIINHCNENGIFYTIISNNTPEIQGHIKYLFDNTDYIEGFTSSVDPVVNSGDSSDRVRKSIEGFMRLKEMQVKGKVKDVVAEITVMKNNLHLLELLVSDLSMYDIYSDITFVDIAKNNHYDFSNVRDERELVYPTYEVSRILNSLQNDSYYKVHMADVLFPMMFDTLPSNYNCELEKGIHNVSVDADGTMRLCLRIRGTRSPEFHVSQILNKYWNVSKEFQLAVSYDKIRLCQLCNHSCLMMSKHIDENDKGQEDLVHIEKRRDK